MAQTASPFRLIRCPSCGTLRTVSARHARRKPQGCRSCRNTDFFDGQAFWLSHFSDDEICLMAESIYDLPLHSIDRTLVASARVV